MNGDISDLIEILTEDERTVMRVLTRIKKSRNNTFHEQSLKQKRPCFNMNIPQLLHGLANKGLVTPVGVRRWRTTRIGRLVAHELERRYNEERYGYLIRRVRGFP